MNTVEFTPIGTIHTPFTETSGTPIQPEAGKDVEGTVELLPEYAEGLADLEGFSHIHLIFHLHQSQGYALRVKPYLDDQLRGLFSTRAPKRPNPIGISTVRLESIEGNIIHFRDADMLDGTPLLDIKPYVPVDVKEAPRFGWLEGKAEMMRDMKDDGRFDDSG